LSADVLEPLHFILLHYHYHFRAGCPPLAVDGPCNGSETSALNEEHG